MWPGPPRPTFWGTVARTAASWATVSLPGSRNPELWSQCPGSLSGHLGHWALSGNSLGTEMTGLRWPRRSGRGGASAGPRPAWGGADGRAGPGAGALDAPAREPGGAQSARARGGSGGVRSGGGRSPGRLRGCGAGCRGRSTVRLCAGAQGTPGRVSAGPGLGGVHLWAGAGRVRASGRAEPLGMAGAARGDPQGLTPGASSAGTSASTCAWSAAGG